jgi:cytochrome c55X
MVRYAFGLVLLATFSSALADPAPARRAELLHLLRQDCGACHGMTLRGGLGPSLEPAALAGKDDEALRFVILRGRPGTPMPPWGEFLTRAEAQWLVRQLKRGLPR